jgi:hypothetical protein
VTSARTAGTLAATFPGVTPSGARRMAFIR